MSIQLRLITALVFSGCICAGAYCAPAAEQSAIKPLADTAVATTVFGTLSELNQQAHQDVQIASYRFEPDTPDTELVARVSVQFFDAEGNEIETADKDGE
ncbi:hypothetical protein DXV75_07030 [Alteromonas aestuariivivens]|uniref:Uncharacterized protein n=1 Tax=Alteromonas aestuariivivens TaxID=1938339 RepID=A0A3D8MA44_9ALTE|nr:hypothetical protein [Alteromonas aestuariivivens]RDV26734.1 hypothetical protein DXV75_07030 [Alteromonas aestuariivivens]